MTDQMVFYTVFYFSHITATARLFMYFLHSMHIRVDNPMKNPVDHVRLEPRASRLRVLHFTTKPLSLTLSSTYIHFNILKKEALEKHYGKR